MEEIVDIIKKNMELFGVTISNQESLIYKESIIGAYLSGMSDYFQNSKISSLQGLYQMIEIFNEDLIQKLIQEKIISNGSTALSLEAISNVVTHLLHKYISKKLVEDLSNIQKQLVTLVKNLLIFYDLAKEKISKSFIHTIDNGMTILIYGYSTHVIKSLIYARKKGKTFTVYVASSSEKDSSQKIIDIFKENDIDCKLILGVSIGFYLSKVDIIITGADAVCENGGIINQIGTYTMAICAKNFKKPFYVLVDSLKYLKTYALDQTDLKRSVEKYLKNDDISEDFTPPEFITSFFTDKGIFTPSAICDEIIQLFYG